MGAFSWLFGGNDHELAATRYAGRESASDRAASKTFGKPDRNATAAARRGQAWEDTDRRRTGSTTGWFRSK